MAQMIGVARLGRDAEVRYTPSGTAVTNLSLAFNYGKKGENDYRPTQWVDGSLWGERAEALAAYLEKGQQLYVVLDDVHIETFRRNDGGEGHKLVGRVATIEFAGSRKDADADDQPTREQRENRAAALAMNNPARTPPPATRQQAARSQSAFDDMDDDIPF